MHALVQVHEAAAVPRAIELARDESKDVVVLGGGSNVIASDHGLDAVVLQIDDDHLSADLTTGRVHVASGYDWDALVAWTVSHGLAGLECLSGIPGRTGAAPIQNIGAYGQEIGDVVETVHAVDLRDGKTVDFGAHDCHFGYRSSRFKYEWIGRYVVTGLTLALQPDGAPTIRYAELERRLDDGGVPRTLENVRDMVLTIRRAKSMVIDPDDENHRSAGSFFTNPIVDDETLNAVRRVARAKDPDGKMPTWPVSLGETKIAAAWLIEHSGFTKGHEAGAAGLSTHHVLALVNRGGARAQDLIDLAREIQDGVHATFGVRLRPEPIPLGFAAGEIDDLWF